MSPRGAAGVGLVALVVFLVLGAADRGDAQAQRPPHALYAAARASWRQCFRSGEPVPAFPGEPDPQDYGTSLEVKRTRSGYWIREMSGGAGVEATYGGVAIDLELRGCRALWARDATFDGALARGVRVGWIHRNAPRDDELRSLLGAEPARPADAPHALARSWLLHACEGGVESTLTWRGKLAGPIAPPQPWHQGTPGPTPATFWSSRALASIGAGARTPAANDEELPAMGTSENAGTNTPAISEVPIAGVFVPAFARPSQAPAFSTAGLDVLEATVQGRNGGRAVALRDRATGRYRWVAVTRGCVQGTTVTWLGAVGARIVGITRSESGRYARGDAILVLDVPSGTAWAIRFPDAIRDEAVDGGVRGTLTGTRLALRAGTKSATMDLRPELARIGARR